MKIIQVAPFEESVPPKKYGGTELVIFNLTEELIRKNHEVLLIATGDSKTSAKLIPTFKSPTRNKMKADVKSREVFNYNGIGKTLNIINSIKNADVIHNHIGWRLLPFLSSIATPVVTTIHGSLDLFYQKNAHKEYKNYPFVSVSDSQREPIPNLNYISTVYNGIDINLFDLKKTQGKYLAFLGKIEPQKGLKEAIIVAKKSKLPLKIAAKIDALGKEYFKKEVKPLIDGKQIQYLGEIDYKQKNNFLKNALALLVPIKWREPFGLVMTEAMACGTPVIAFNRGSVPEVIKNNKTGFIVKNIDEMVESIGKIKKIKREDCRKLVEEKFTSKIMAENYEKVYEKMIKSNKS